MTDVFFENSQLFIDGWIYYNNFQLPTHDLFKLTFQLRAMIK